MSAYNALVQKSKRLAFLLRHDDSYQFDDKGYRDVKDLIRNCGYTLSELIEIVKSDDKQRYEFNEDKTKIRARQGHSVDVDVELKEATPPDVLYHGTCTHFYPSIIENGILSQSRLYVHLSLDEETAINVGERHGQPIVIKIDAKRMVEDGIKFYLSANNVWLTEYVDIKYFIK